MSELSFCQKHKNEIISAQYKSVCCRRALLSGVLAAKGTFSDGFVELRVSDAAAIRFISSLVCEMYSNEPEEVNSKAGGRGKILRFKSSSAAKFVREIENNDGLMYQPRCGACRSSFLRGAFLAAGRVSEPSNQYLLEFSFSEASTDRFLSFFSELGIGAKITIRAGRRVLYTKNSTCIEDFFGLAAMNGTTFDIMNSKIKSELRNDANRVANCEMHNINLAVNTAMRQIAIISALDEAGLLGALPEELAMTARLRLEYNSLSLSQLASKFTPSISKPGLSHRLNKIEELGKKLLQNVK